MSGALGESHPEEDLSRRLICLLPEKRPVLQGRVCLVPLTLQWWCPQGWVGSQAFWRHHSPALLKSCVHRTRGSCMWGTYVSLNIASNAQPWTMPCEGFYAVLLKGWWQGEQPVSFQCRYHFPQMLWTHSLSNDLSDADSKAAKERLHFASYFLVCLGFYQHLQSLSYHDNSIRTSSVCLLPYIKF